MSLMIQGMEMPKRCYDCELFSGEGYLCPLVETTDNWQEIMYKRVADCPLVEIPTPHGRLIDADAYQYSGDLIDEPTIIEAEE